MRSRAAWTVWSDLITVGALLAGIGLAAIGISGLVAVGLGAMFGPAFVAGDPPGVTYTAERCRQFMELQPNARSCADAAIAHHYGEVVEYRLAAGILGVAALAVGWWLRQRRGRSVLPDGFEASIASALFGVAAAGLLLQSFGLAVIGGESNGVGALLSGGLVSAVAAALFGVVLYRVLLARAVRNSAPGSST